MSESWNEQWTQHWHFILFLNNGTLVILHVVNQVSVAIHSLKQSLLNLNNCPIGKAMVTRLSNCLYWKAKYYYKLSFLLSFVLPETTPRSSTGQGMQCSYRFSSSLGDCQCSVCCGRACWCRCWVAACTEPPWLGSPASHRSYCRDSSLPLPTCQHSRHIEKVFMALWNQIFSGFHYIF